MEAHKPELYVGGAFIRQRDLWLGDFEASAYELFQYAENDVRTVEEYTMVIDMLGAQQIYQLWWERLQKNLK